jgi:4-amino-4-deoxy-L-arabinose transferase-like glycosyltransferase
MVQDDTSRPSLDASPKAFAWLASPPIIIGLIAAYLIGHFALRLLLSPTLGIDDAEQTLFAQQWAFGYRFRQPPLFTWLLLPVTDLLGPGVLAISLVRYALLAVTFIFFYLTARLCLSDQRMAGLAALSLASIYVFAYFAHHDLTHTTALSAMIALSFYVTVRLAKNPSLAAYLIAGVVFGLGMLGKWNFLMLATGLPLACLLHPSFRHLALTPKLLAAVAAMTAIVAPTALWMAAHGQSVDGVSSTILNPSGHDGGLALWLDGGGALLRSIVLFPLPFLPLFLIIFGRNLVAGFGIPAPAGEASLAVSLFGSLILIVLALHALLIPLFGAVNFTERWLHPALMVLPIVLFAVAERVTPSKRQIALYLGAIAILVAVAGGARLYRYEEGANDCGRCREFAPFAEFVGGIHTAGFSRGTIIADGMHIGGNFRMLFAESRVVDPAFPLALWPDADEDGATDGCLLVWRDEDDASDARRDAMRQFAERELGLAGDAPSAEGRLDALLLGSSHRRYVLGYELYQEDTGGCR